MVCYFFLFKQKTAYELRISDWSSDVCSSDLGTTRIVFDLRAPVVALKPHFESGAGGTRLVLEWPGDSAGDPIARIAAARSEERRVGKECVSTCRYRGSPSH